MPLQFQLRYKELMEESAKESKKLNSVPVPHTCFTVKPCTVKSGANPKGVSKWILLITTVDAFNLI